MSRRLSASAWRYALVGGACALTHNVVMIGGAALRLHYLVSAAVSFAIVVLLGYGLHTAFTFRSAISAPAFARYAVAMLGNYPATVALLYVLCDLLHAPMTIAAPVATALLFGWNYVASRWAIARRLLPSPPPEPPR